MAKPLPAWKNRIVGYGEESPDQLLANPANFRTHPRNQQDTLSGILSEVGVVQNVIVNKRTGYVVDGHLRISLAMREHQPTVPVTYVDLSEAEESLILATLDPISAMATADRDKLDELLRDVSTSDAAVMQMLSDLAEQEGVTEFASDSPEQVVTKDDAFDIWWPSDNEWGIPSLDITAQADHVARPFTRWGSSSRKNAMPGTYHFYTDDYKFMALWDDPTPVPNSGCKAAVEPNISTGSQSPKAAALFSVYQKRWMSRFWQEYGVPVIVDLNVHPDFRDINLLGVPRGWRSYATRGSDGLDWIEGDCKAAEFLAGTTDLTFVVYGGPKALAETCQQRGWLFVPEDAQVQEGRWNG